MILMQYANQLVSKTLQNRLFDPVRRHVKVDKPCLWMPNAFISIRVKGNAMANRVMRPPARLML